MNRLKNIALTGVDPQLCIPFKFIKEKGFEPVVTDYIKKSDLLLLIIFFTFPFF